MRASRRIDRARGPLSQEWLTPAGAGLGAGVLMAASLPPWGWWPLAPLGAAVVAHVPGGRSWGARALVGAAAGVGLFAPGLWWVTEFSAPGYVVLTVVEAAFVALALVAVPPRRGRLVALPAALVVVEGVRGHWPLGGLPLGGLALGQVGGPLAPAARLGGHLLVVALVGAAGSGLAAVAEWAGRRRPKGSRSSPVLLAGGLGALAAVAAVGVGGRLAFSGSPATTLRVAAVQGGGPRGLRAVFADPDDVFAAQLRATAGVRRPVDVVLWPEDVVDVDGPLAGSAKERAVAALASSLGTTVVAGVVEDTAPGRFRNAAVAWGPDGGHLARYDKVHRVPFGEYVPARRLFGHLADLSAVPRDAIAGRGPGILATPPGRLGVLVSYEVFFADRARAAARAGGQVLLVPTNASSYSTSQVPTQELAAARLRAVETGRALVQAAPTGLSAVVDADGRVVARSRLGPAAVVERTLSLRTGQTLATRLGDGPLTVLAALALVAVNLRGSKLESLNDRLVASSAPGGVE